MIAQLSQEFPDMPILVVSADERAILKAMAVRPGDRFEDVESFGRALTDALVSARVRSGLMPRPRAKGASPAPPGPAPSSPPR